jgi:Holliday junction resolvase
MVDSRRKGATAERKARDELRKYTGLKWERTPGSGALGPQHKLKGDLYVPDAPNFWCVEVKHYKDDQLTSKILTSKSPIFLDWWRQAVRQADQVDKEPLLIFKFDRSKWFIAWEGASFCNHPHYDGYAAWDDKIKKNIDVYIEGIDIGITTLDEFCTKVNNGIWLNQSTN